MESTLSQFSKSIALALFGLSGVLLFYGFIEKIRITDQVVAAGNGYDLCSRDFPFTVGNPLEVILSILAVAVALYMAIPKHFNVTKMLLNLVSTCAFIVIVMMMLINIATTECGPIGPDVGEYSDTSSPYYINSVFNNSETQTQIFYSASSQMLLRQQSYKASQLVTAALCCFIFSGALLAISSYSRTKDDDDDTEKMIEDTFDSAGFYIGKIPVIGEIWGAHAFFLLLSVAIIIAGASFVGVFTGEFVGSSIHEDVCQYELSDPSDYVMPCLDIDTKAECQYYAYEHHAISMFSDSCAVNATTPCVCGKNNTNGIVTWANNVTGLTELCNTPTYGNGGGCKKWEILYYETHVQQLASLKHEIFHIPLRNPVISTPKSCDYSGFTSDDCLNMAKTIVGNYSATLYSVNESTLGSTQQGCFILPKTDGSKIYWKYPDDGVATFSGDTVGICKANNRSLNVYNETSNEWHLFNNYSLVDDNSTQPATVSFTEAYWNVVHSQSTLVNGKKLKDFVLGKKGVYVLDDDSSLNNFLNTVSKSNGHTTGTTPRTLHEAKVGECWHLHNEVSPNFFKISTAGKLAAAVVGIGCVYAFVLIVVDIMKFFKVNWEDSKTTRFLMWLFQTFIGLLLWVLSAILLLQVVSFNRYVDCPNISAQEDNPIQTGIVLLAVGSTILYLCMLPKLKPSYVDSSSIEGADDTP